jgi:hypothetical protein
MKPKVIVWCALLGSLLFATEARLSPRYQTVFILGMTNGLDQYLASRLTNSRVLWVVLEPTNADAVLTDTLDDSFWSWLARSYPPAGGAADSASRGSTLTRDSLSSGKSRGNVFLVDPRRRVVLWSMYALPKASVPLEMDRTASRVATQLGAAFGKK